MTDRDDLQLLWEFADSGSQAAFCELVRRHIDLVYTSAVRQVGDRHAAEDVTQTVFIILTRKARQIRPGSVLSAWLLGVTRFAAIDYLKRDRRRRHYEHAAAIERTVEMMSAENDAALSVQTGGATVGQDPETQSQLARVLDDALSRLSGSARDALVMRFFENQSFKQVGERLGISEVAARQRVFRGLERLRVILGRRGVSLGGESLAGALVATAVMPAPGPLNAAVAATAMSAGASAPYAALVKGTGSLMKISFVKPVGVTALVLVVVAAFALAGASAFKSKSPLRDRGQTLAANPLPAQPIPAKIRRRTLLAPIDVFPPENYTPPNYVPRNSAWPAPAQRDMRTGALPRYVGPPLSGVVKSPGGQPLPGAQVSLLTSFSPPAYSGLQRGLGAAEHTFCDANGRFEITPRFQPQGLFAKSLEGYAWIPADSIKPSQTITLSRWGRLELTVKDRAEPLAQARVMFYPAGPGGIAPIPANVLLTVDDQGHVTVEQVLPGEVRLAWSDTPTPKLPPREMRVVVEPGKTHKVSLGGVGRPVAGAIAADVTDFTYRRGVLRWHMPRHPSADPKFDEMPEADRKRVIQEWENSPQKKAADEGARRTGVIYFDALADGSFIVDDVPPGDYEIAIDLGMTVGRNIKIVETQATARTTFTVPPIPGDFSDKPLDIGLLQVAKKEVLDVGAPFPKLEGLSAAGEPISTRDFPQRVLLVQVGGSSAVQSRGELDWLFALHSHFGNNPGFAMLSVTADQDKGPDPVFGDTWPLLRLEPGKLPGELQASTAPMFLVDADGAIAAKNVTGAQVYAVLDKVLAAKPDARVTYDFVPRAEARQNPPFDKIPGPSESDAANGARVSLVAGIPSWDTPKSNVSVLTDGRMAPTEDSPGEAIFFQAGSLEGRFRIELKELTDIAEVRTYSWHKDTRGAQVFRLYASDGLAANFDSTPRIGMDPAKCGWTPIAFVDTRPDMKPVGTQKTAHGGRYVSSIADPAKGSLGKYRHLLFQVFPTEADDVFGHTFYSEVDVIARGK